MNLPFNVNKVCIYLTHPHVGVWNFSDRQKRVLQGFFPQAAIEICPNSKAFRAALPEADVDYTDVNQLSNVDVRRAEVSLARR